MFIMPFLIGFVFFFAGLIIQTFQISRSQMAIGPDGFTLIPIGWANYNRLFLVDPDFLWELLGAVGNMLPEVGTIVIFSFFAATLINQKFIGRTFARGVMFLPIILTSGIILYLEMNDTMLAVLGDTGNLASSFDGDTLRLLMSITNMFGDISFEFGNFEFNLIIWVVIAIEGIYDIVIASGVQILIFLAGLQSIPPSLYEASTVEGATGWENFWKITFPMVSPLILVNVVYSVIDSFTRPDNVIMMRIHDMAFGIGLDFGGSAATSFVYFLVIILALALVVGIISRMVFYYDD